ncbi:ATP-binding cassette, subfamily B [Catalinimonas alkaloidigena]|uniref:ATP-binding cassette, subfamily B n=1 Tax=Catalinimonas alkaloidigena TaxID=1075417 RepID=A0A1G9EQA4_9BACT|nr:ABC transporter ATP-binding protein [Catalinimonas alkaloidigena]SDK78253.1 ATP-binding cassette, subfamily B [Catalinimonas alkaloidigena]
MKALRRINHYFYKYKSHLIWGTIFIIISNVFAVVPAQVVRQAFDLIKETIDIYRTYEGFELQEAFYDIFLDKILFYGILIVGMALLRGVFLFFTRQTIIVMSRHIEYDQKNEIYEHYQSLPLSFYRRHNTGDLMARISEDVSRVRMYVGPAIMYGINLIALFALVISYMFSVNAELSLYVLLPLPVLSVSIYFVNNIINKRSEEIQRSLSNLSTFVQEAFSGIRVLKAFTREGDSLAQFEKESNDYRYKSMRLVRVDSLFFPLMLALIGLSTILTVYIGGLQVMAGKITVGIIAEFVIYVNMLTWPVASLGWTASLIQRAAASQQRINEFLDVKTDIVSRKELSKDIHGKIVFDQVSFVYPDSGIKALDHVSFEVKPGESIAILGTTGSGKSTVANLICRMYDPTGGNVTIDEVDVRDYNLHSLRGQIGYVPQDVFLFSDTIRNNITFGLQGVSDDRVVQAAEDADLYHNVIDFPEGFSTKVGERGITLSGGQKQRVSIARALVRDPNILILDDSLSAVDTKTENRILGRLKGIMENRTTVIISHRVSSAKLADRILVLDEGKVVEQGTHDTLLAAGGVYKELYDKQLTTEEAA